MSNERVCRVCVNKAGNGYPRRDMAILGKGTFGASTHKDLAAGIGRLKLAKNDEERYSFHLFLWFSIQADP